MLRTLVFLAFFCSGFTSLVLETLWMRMLVLVFGGTTLAIVTILTAFMGGLALGSAIAGKLSARIERPLRIYGWLELGVAVYAALSPWWISQIPFLYQWVPMSWPFWATALVRFVLCVLLLLLPTALMGATLPVLSQLMVRRHHRLGIDVGMLYSINTWGAVTGALLGGFVLLPLWGHRWTLGAVSTLLAVVALGMLWLSRRSGPHAHFPPMTKNTSAAQELADEGLAAFAHVATPSERKLALLGISLAGSIAMICQVIWSRSLAMVIGSSTYAFTLNLGLCLFGIALGAMWGAWLVRHSLHITKSWATLLLATGIAIGMGAMVIDRLPLLFIWLVYDSVGKVGVVGMFALKAAITALPVFLPALLMGTFFPLALAVYGREEDAASASVGRLYAANTLGSILGAALTGFVLIPLLGLQGCLALCVTMCCGLAIALGWPAPPEPEATNDTNDTNDTSDTSEELFPSPDQGPRWAMMGMALFVGVAIWFAPPWHPGRMSLGMFRLSLLKSYTYETAKTPANVLFYREGISATVTVQGGETHRGLKINGKADASSISDSGTQVASAALPLLIHPNPRQVAIIGWGSGMTAGAALHFPLKQLTALELEPAVVTAAKLFRKWNFRPHRDKRLRLLYNDGRNFLARTHQRFDVISSEPSNPWMAGTANLFTAEFFQLARKRLKPGGLHCQFIQLYELSYSNILTLMRSARSAFPTVRLFEVQPNNYDTLLVASPQPITLDLATLQQRMAAPKYKELWRRMGVEDAFDWLPRLALGEQEIDELLRATPVPRNTDDHNIIEFTAPYDLVRHASSQAATTFQQKVRGFGMRFRRYFQRKGVSLQGRQTATFWRKASRAFLRYGKFAQAKKLLSLAAKEDPKHLTTRHLQRMHRLMQSQERPPNLPTRYKVPKADHGWLAMLYKARRLFFADREKQSISLLQELTKVNTFTKRYPVVWFYLGANARHTQAYADAYRYYERFVKETSRLATHPKATSGPTSQPTSHPVSQPTPRPASQPTSLPTSPSTPRLSPRAASQPARPPTQVPRKRPTTKPLKGPTQPTTPTTAPPATRPAAPLRK